MWRSMRPSAVAAIGCARTRLPAPPRPEGRVRKLEKNGEARLRPSEDALRGRAAPTGNGSVRLRGTVTLNQPTCNKPDIVLRVYRVSHVGDPHSATPLPQSNTSRGLKYRCGATARLAQPPLSAANRRFM